MGADVLRFSRLVHHLTHAPHLTSSSASGLTLGKNDLMPSITSGGIARPGKVAACRLRCRVRGRCTFLSRRWSSFQTDPARSRLSIGTIGTSRDSAQRWVPTARSRLGSAFLRPVNIKMRLSPAIGNIKIRPVNIKSRLSPAMGHIAGLRATPFRATP